MLLKHITVVIPFYILMVENYKTKTMKKILLVILPLLFLTILINCKKQQPQINEDIKNPCDCATEVSADFDMLEISGQTNSIFERTTPTDTIFKNKSVKFLAKDSTANYTWYIGTEVLTDREVVRYFDQSLVGQDLPITLVVKKTPNNICFPSDDGYDSIVKILHVSPYPIAIAPNLDLGSIEGTYRVKSEHKADSFDIVFYTSINGLGENKFNIENYDGNGSNCLNQANIGEYLNYRQVGTSWGTSTSQCDYIKGSIHNRLDGVTEMNFSFGSNNVNADYYYERKYLGRKLN